MCRVDGQISCASSACAREGPRRRYCLDPSFGRRLARRAKRRHCKIGKLHSRYWLRRVTFSNCHPERSDTPRHRPKEVSIWESDKLTQQTDQIWESLVFLVFGLS